MKDKKNQKPLIEMKDIIKKYYIGEPNELQILQGISLNIYEGEFVAIVGESGSGKSTLMNIIGALDKPTEGSYILDGIDVQNASEKEMNNIRNQKIGFVFQNFYLNNKLTALENVLLPMYINGNVDLNKAKDLLKTFNVLDRESHYPYELSGGEQQRVSLARALVNNPKYILADEPTGNLDSKNEDEVFNYLKDISKDKCVIVVSHNEKIKNYADKVVYLEKGVLKDEN